MRKIADISNHKSNIMSGNKLYEVAMMEANLPRAVETLGAHSP